MPRVWMSLKTTLVNVYTSASILLAQFVFGNAEDARTFADLVASFRVRRAGQG